MKQSAAAIRRVPLLQSMLIASVLLVPAIGELSGTPYGDWSGPALGGPAGPTPRYWVNLSALPHPSARLWEGLSFDEVDREIVLFGGINDLGPRNDTWSFRNGTWTDLTPTLPVAPSPRYYPGMTWDPSIGAVVLFGGQTEKASLSDTWIFVHDHWSNITRLVGPAPSGRAYAAMTYDSTDRFVLLFGGFNESPLQEYGDTWEFTAHEWTNVTANLAQSPPPRPDAGMVDDPPHGWTILFGGDSPHDTVPFYNDTWGFAHGVWRNLTDSSGLAPSGREDPAMAFDAADGFVVLFGGTTTPGIPNLSDTWVYSGLRWTNLTSSLPISPPARGGARMDYDPAGGYVLMFGGAGLELLGDSWTLSLHPITGSAPPAPHAAAWIVLLAGVAAGIMGGLVGSGRPRRRNLSLSELSRR